MKLIIIFLAYGGYFPMLVRLSEVEGQERLLQDAIDNKKGFKGVDAGGKKFYLGTFVIGYYISDVPENYQKKAVDILEREANRGEEWR